LVSLCWQPLLFTTLPFFLFHFFLVISNFTCSYGYFCPFCPA
jgi:hypothetical protein